MVNPIALSQRVQLNGNFNKQQSKKTNKQMNISTLGKRF